MNRCCKRSPLALALFGALIISGCAAAPKYDPFTPVSLVPGESRTLDIQATGTWRDSGIEVQPGEVYRLTTAGQWSPGPLCGNIGASGLPTEHPFCFKILIKDFPLADAALGALVAKIGEHGAPFLIGGKEQFVANQSGHLFLQINEPASLLWDNVGALSVAIQRFSDDTGAVVLSPPATAKSAPVPASNMTSIDPENGPVAPFNVLDKVIYQPQSGQLTLIGHYDMDYAGPTIPYIQHLSALLENPAPAFSLEWTKDSERKVDAFMARMDSTGDWQQVTSESMQLVDGAGNLTSQAKLILPMLGIRPTTNGKAPGYLGVSIKLNKHSDFDVVSVEPGSPAYTAGIRKGDIIGTTSLGQFFHPTQFYREIRRAGAGTTINLGYYRPSASDSRQVKITLSAAAGDPWAGLTRKDVILAVLRKGGESRLAAMVQKVMDIPMLLKNDVPIQSHMIGIYWEGKKLEKYNETFALRNSGAITQQQGEIRVMRLVPEILDDMMMIPGRPITSTYDAKIAQGYDYGSAYDDAISEMERHLKQRFIRIWQRLVSDPEEIVLPIDQAESAMGFRPEVEPRFIRLEPVSALARVMFEADYVIKTMIHNPALTERIPGYQTLYAFERGKPSGSSATTVERMWLSIDRLDLVQSPDGNSLQTRGARMRFNIEGVGGRSVSAPYAGHLTSLYDGIAREVPVFHELREAAKLTGVAMWLRQKAKRPQLPAVQAAWQPPKVLPGAIYQSWSPKAGENRVIMMAMGGVSLIPPVGDTSPVWPPNQPFQVPSDASVVDLSDVELSATPKLFRQDHSQIARSLRQLKAPPVPRPAWWVARHKKGARALNALNVTADELNRCEAKKSAELNVELEHARQIAGQLDAVEAAINVMSADYSSRQKALAEWNTRLLIEEEAFKQNALDVATQGVSAAHASMRTTRLARRWGSANELAGEILSAKTEMDTFEQRVRRAAAFTATLRADDIASRNEAIRQLTAVVREIGENAAALGGDRVIQALRGAGRNIRYISMAIGAAKLGSNLITLGNAWRQIGTMTKMTEQELQSLKDKLLPMKRALSDQLDEVMAQPNVKAWLNNQALCK